MQEPRGVHGGDGAFHGAMTLCRVTWESVQSSRTAGIAPEPRPPSGSSLSQPDLPTSRAAPGRAGPLLFILFITPPAPPSPSCCHKRRLRARVCARGKQPRYCRGTRPRPTLIEEPGLPAPLRHSVPAPPLGPRSDLAPAPGRCSHTPSPLYEVAPGCSRAAARGPWCHLHSRAALEGAEGVLEKPAPSSSAGVGVCSALVARGIQVPSLC